MDTTELTTLFVPAPGHGRIVGVAPRGDQRCIDLVVRNGGMAVVEDGDFPVVGIKGHLFGLRDYGAFDLTLVTTGGDVRLVGSHRDLDLLPGWLAPSVGSWIGSLLERWRDQS